MPEMVRVPDIFGGSIINTVCIQAGLPYYKLALSVPAGGEAGNFEMVFMSVRPIIWLICKFRNVRFAVF